MKKSDPFGKALLDEWQGKKSFYLIERDDGFTTKEEAAVYFEEPKEWGSIEKALIENARRIILDIGAGAGRHTLFLQKFYYNDVKAIDNSPGAVEVMEQRGVKDVSLMDLRTIELPLYFFNAVLMMFNNFGLAGGIKETQDLLRQLAYITDRRGIIIATIRNYTKTDNPRHLAYRHRNIEAGYPPGLVRIRIHYGKVVGDKFNLLMLTPRELEDLLKNTDWDISEIIEKKEEPYYGVILKKK